VQERKIQPNGTEDPVWLRTCYDIDLEEAYQELREGADLSEGYGLSNIASELDDSSLYNFAADWKRVLIRLPEFCDYCAGSVSEDYDEWEEFVEGNSEMGELEKISRRISSVVYVVDEEAIRERLVKVMWLDYHGNCVWDNKSKPEDLESLRAGLIGGGSLYEMVEESGLNVLSPARGDILAK
jgi:hypothetical protein